MHTNLTKQKLMAGETVLGCWIRYPDPGVAELLAYQGWDYLVFDAEHGTIEPRDCENMVRAAELHDATPIVRVTSNQAPIVLRFLDTGAQGVHIPLVDSAGAAEEAVQSVKYWPRGGRGLGGARAASYGQTLPFGEYVEHANRETLVVVQIESPLASEELDAICAVEGVDVIFIGPSDLSQSLGLPGQPGHPKVEEAMARIVEAAARADAVLGVLVPDLEAARRWRDRGARYIGVTLEALVRSSARGFLAALRG